MRKYLELRAQHGGQNPQGSIPVAEFFNLRYNSANGPTTCGRTIIFSSLETVSASALGRLPVASFEWNMTKQTALPSQLAPRLIGREAAAAYVNLSPTVFDRLVSDGRMPKPRQLTAHRKAWDVRELDVAVDNLPKEGESEGDADDGWDD
ncbi:putative DNA-binding transcriptional regulator AlpA [Bradyrhizobium sp. USDA 4472]